MKIQHSNFYVETNVYPITEDNYWHATVEIRRGKSCFYRLLPGQTCFPLLRDIVSNDETVVRSNIKLKLENDIEYLQIILEDLKENNII